VTVDLTGIAVSIVSGIFSILGIVALAWLQSHIKDQAAAATLSTAVQNSLGALQQAATSEIQTLHPSIPGVPANLAPGVQFVLDHAGDEATRLGVTPVAIAQKVEAAVGLANIATNLATTQADIPAIVPPLDPVVAIDPKVAVAAAVPAPGTVTTTVTETPRTQGKPK
jgi:hypothetical protein